MAFERILFLGTKKSVSLITLFGFVDVKSNSNFKRKFFKPNKTGLFEGSFFYEGVGGGHFDTSHSYFKKNLSNANITLYNY